MKVLFLKIMEGPIWRFRFKMHNMLSISRAHETVWLRPLSDDTGGRY